MTDAPRGPLSLAQQLDAILKRSGLTAFIDLSKLDGIKGTPAEEFVRHLDDALTRRATEGVDVSWDFSKQGAGFEALMRVAIDFGCLIKLEGAPDGSDGFTIDMEELGVNPLRRFYCKRTYDLEFTAGEARKYFESGPRVGG